MSMNAKFAGIRQAKNVQGNLRDKLCIDHSIQKSLLTQLQFKIEYSSALFSSVERTATLSQCLR
jgi:hypothetical protein